MLKKSITKGFIKLTVNETLGVNRDSVDLFDLEEFVFESVYVGSRQVLKKQVSLSHLSVFRYLIARLNLRKYVPDCLGLYLEERVLPLGIFLFV